MLARLKSSCADHKSRNSRLFSSLSVVIIYSLTRWNTKRVIMKAWRPFLLCPPPPKKYFSHSISTDRPDRYTDINQCFPSHFVYSHAKLICLKTYPVNWHICRHLDTRWAISFLSYLASPSQVRPDWSTFLLQLPTVCQTAQECGSWRYFCWPLYCCSYVITHNSST